MCDLKQPNDPFRYLTADKTNNVSLDAQMQTIADLYNGRIVIVNSSYKIMTDTFNLSTGKYYISEEVIRCFKGESGSSFNKEGGYFTRLSLFMIRQMRKRSRE